MGESSRGHASSGEDRPSDGDLSVVTRTDSQEEQRFEAEESQRSPESFPRTARIENAPDGLRLRLEVRRARSQAELADEETWNRTWWRAALDSRGAGREDDRADTFGTEGGGGGRSRRTDQPQGSNGPERGAASWEGKPL